MRGELGEAVSALKRSSALLLKDGQRRSAVYLLFASGVVHDQIGAYAEARSAQEQALEMVLAFRARWSEVMVRGHLAMIMHHQGDHTSAISHSDRVIQLGEEYGIRYELPLALLAKGHAYAALHVWQAAIDAYKAIIDLYQALGQEHLICEPRAGLIRVALAQGDQQTVRQQLDLILDQVSGNNLNGTYDPLQVYLTCYEALASAGDAHSADLLGRAYTELQRRAATFSDAVARNVFLDDVAVNRRISELWSASHQ